jgi:ferredoxin
MTYVVTDACIRCKYTDCVSVCPVDCFHEGENMLVIDPEVCIDCGVCEPECPADAIVADSNGSAAAWLDLNRSLSGKWPVIADAMAAPPDADAYKGVAGKFDRYFSAAPAAR